MATFIIETTARASIREFWRVEGKSAAHVRTSYDSSVDVPGDLIFDEVLGDEEGRLLDTVHTEQGLAGTLAIHARQESSAEMLKLLQHVAGVLDMSDADHPAFRDSCADAVEALWQHEPEIRGLLRRLGA